MKKLVILFLMSFVCFSANADVGLVGRSTSLDNLGAVKAGSLEKWYVNVKNQSGGSVADGKVVVIDVANDDGYSVTTSTALGAVPHCVIAKADGSACADDEMCRCQTYGLNAGVGFDSTNSGATAGESAFISESFAGSVQAEAITSLQPYDIPLGVFYDSPSASADTEVFIKLRK